MSSLAPGEPDDAAAPARAINASTGPESVIP